jgi:hypothetical protein
MYMKAGTIFPILILIGCVLGVLYFQRNMWAGLTPSPVVQTLTGTWTGNAKIWLEKSPDVSYSYSVELVLKQSGASVTGTITLDTTTFQITDGRIQSEQIQFKADNMVWSGTFTTNSMVGTEQQDTSIPLPSGMGYGDIWVGTFNLYRGY